MDKIPDWDDSDYFEVTDIDNSLRDKRIKICNDCRELTKFKFCKKCRCFMPVKVWFESTACPLNKW